MSEPGYGKGLKATLVNCSLKKDRADSHTLRLMNRVAGIMRDEDVEVDVIHALEHQIGFGMVEDAGDGDEWPALWDRIMAADIVVLGTPIWLGVKASVATLVVERMYAYSAETNEKGQYVYYGKTGGCVVTGNEDGVKACAMDMLYALQHIGFAIPPQADCGWIGEVGPGPSYGDEQDDGPPAGYNSEFTNKNTTFMTWNLMHMARMLKDNGGIPAVGNHSDWREVSNAEDQSPDPV